MDSLQVIITSVEGCQEWVPWQQDGYSWMNSLGKNNYFKWEYIKDWIIDIGKLKSFLDQKSAYRL